MSYHLVPAYHNNWSPFHAFNREMRMMRNMADNEDSPTVEPSYSYESDDKGAHFEIEMPGVPKDNVSIEVKGHKLIVSGKRFKKTLIGNTDKTDDVDKVEPKPTMTYVLEARLGHAADLDEIRAEHEGNGVLDVYIPMKLEKDSRSIQISIQD